MPTYAYACTTCDEQIEVVQRFTDAPLTDCPSCTGTLRKVFHPVGIVFKGSGFYKTDARSSGRRSSSSSSAPASTDSAPASAPASTPATSGPSESPGSSTATAAAS